jgi:Chromo (CHRromatin Organisation MOdifier) domain
VEQILKHRKRGQGYKYLIKWVSYPITEASCEPKSNPRTPSTLDYMLFFEKSKSTSNLCQQNHVRWNDLEECLKIECLIKDMHQKYTYMFQPYQYFSRPTPLSPHQVLAEIRSKK